MNHITKIYGGPGCGKTTKLLEILDDLLKTVPASRIAFVSFTNKGTDAGVNRARIDHNLSKKDTPYWDTIHAIANREACKDSGTIISKDNYKAFSLATGMKFLGHISEELNHGDDTYLFMEQLKRTNIKKFNRMKSSIPDLYRMNWLISQYRQYKKIYGIYDFTDMLEIYLKKGKPLDIDYMIIDEAQDLTPLQWKVVEVMASRCKRVYIAGDDDQAIYEWCGGDVSIFQATAADETIVLDSTYRLNHTILEASTNLVRTITTRQPKEIYSVHSHTGIIAIHTDISQVPVRADKSYYFLARNRCFLKHVKDYMLGFVYPFVDRGVYYPRTITKANKAKLSDLEYRFCLWMKEKEYKRNLVKDKRITLDTIHRVKGGEADVVVLMLDNTPAVRANLLANPDEELRVLYTGMTRARHDLHIVLSKQYVSYDSIMARAINRNNFPM